MADFLATTGDDNETQTGGPDTLTVTNTNQINPNDFFDGDADIDAIVIGIVGAGVAIDLRGVTTDGTHGFHNYEALTFLNTSATSNARFNALQFDAGLISLPLLVTGVNGSGQSVTIDSATNFSAAGFAFFTWEATDTVNINGTFGPDTITGSSQSDVITGAEQLDTLDGAEGGDTYVLFGDFIAGEIINNSGTSGTDTLRVVAASGNVDFSVGTVVGIEAVTITNTATTIINASQLPASIVLTGDDINVQIFEIRDATNYSAAGWTFVEWSADDLLTFSGTAGADTITGSSQDDSLIGAGSNDILSGGLGNDDINGGIGLDTAAYGSGAGVKVSLLIAGAQNTVGAGIDTLTAIENLTGSAAGADTLTGNGAVNVLNGLGANDKLFGLSGQDTLNGGAGKDTLTGGLNRDFLTGGADRDLFDFNSVTETRPGAANWDVIKDFKRGTNITGDDIDLRTIDAKTGVAGNNGFKFIGTDTFNKVKGELRLKDSGANLVVQGDVNGDGKADFEILVVNKAALSAGDFLL